MFFVHKRIISAVKRVEFVSDRMSYIILRGRWFHIIVLNVHAPAEDTQILLGDFNAKVGREDILNRQLEMEVYTILVIISS
jgi:hypothetical protein